jgi:diguanylate cyclase (GGDEF)-like protein
LSSAGFVGWLVRVAEVPLGVLLIASLSVVGLVGLADYLSGRALSLSVFYLIPAVLAATKGRGPGLFVAATAGVTGFLADIAGRSTPDLAATVPLWNAIMRLTVVALAVTLVDALLGSARHERQLAHRDHLTDLQNSRAFYDSAETELLVLSRTGRPLTLACIDIDRFKRVNDRLGHAAGDAVLIGTGRILTSTMREVDTVARIGGDEFMLLLPETDLAEARVALGRAHRSLVAAATAIGWDIGYSVGVMTFTSPPGTVEEMVAQADGIMYTVKRSEKGTIRYSVS